MAIKVKSIKQGLANPTNYGMRVSSGPQEKGPPYGGRISVSKPAPLTKAR